MAIYCSRSDCKAGALAQKQAETTTKLLGNPFCPEHAAVESAKSPRDRVLAYLHRENFKESEKDFYKLEDGSNIAVDLRGFGHVVGVIINGKLEEEGHGVLKIIDIRNTIEDLLEKKSAGKQKESKAQPKSAEVVKPKGEVKKMEPEKALVVKEPEVTLSIEVIKQYICPTATDAEAFNFLQLCHYRGLNPFLKEAYLIKYGTGTASMVVGKDAFTRKAEESSAFDGYEAGIVILTKEGKIEEREGTIVLKDETLLGGYAKVRRKNTTLPFVNKVGFNEFNKNQGNWKTMPAVMIRKCALVGALREAFTKELGGCYDAAELDPNADVKPDEAKS